MIVAMDAGTLTGYTTALCPMHERRYMLHDAPLPAEQQRCLFHMLLRQVMKICFQCMQCMLRLRRYGVLLEP